MCPGASQALVRFKRSKKWWLAHDEKPMKLPKLTRNNYENWAWLVKMALTMRSLWEVVDPKSTKENAEKDGKAMFLIAATLPADLTSLVKREETAREVWSSIRHRYAKSKAVNRLRLHGEFYNFTMDDFSPTTADAEEFGIDPDRISLSWEEDRR